LRVKPEFPLVILPSAALLCEMSSIGVISDEDYKILSKFIRDLIRTNLQNLRECKYLSGCDHGKFGCSLQTLHTALSLPKEKICKIMSSVARIIMFVIRATPGVYHAICYYSKKHGLALYYDACNPRSPKIPEIPEKYDGSAEDMQRVEEFLNPIIAILQLLNEPQKRFVWEQIQDRQKGIEMLRRR
jgi:hypothetical protein